MENELTKDAGACRDVTTPKLAIVIPCKNEVKYIMNLLYSLEAQTYDLSDTAIFIADAQSEDGTVELLNQYIKEGKLNVHLIQGGYPSFGRNNGAKHSKSKYLLFLDADVELLEDDFIESLINKAEIERLDCVGTLIKGIDPNWKDILIWHAMTIALHLYPILGPFNAGMCVFMRRSAFERLGGFNESVILGEDIELTQKVNKSKFGIANRHILTSNRRFKKMGYRKTMYLYTMAKFSKDFRTGNNANYFEAKQS